MPKPQEYIFKLINGDWQSITPVNSGELLTNFLDRFGVVIDDYAIFVRIRRGNMIFAFREYGRTIRINIYYV